jgi:hypothetical protein
MIPGWIDAENMIPAFLKDLESSESEGDLDTSLKIGGRLSKNPTAVDLGGKSMPTINEEANEGSLNDDSLPPLDAIFDQAIQERSNESDAIEYGLHDFNEADHAATLDRLSLMDRDRYLELLKLKHKYSNMKADLLRADEFDLTEDQQASAKTAWGINVQYG